MTRGSIAVYDIPIATVRDLQNVSLLFTATYLIMDRVVCMYKYVGLRYRAVGGLLWCGLDGVQSESSAEID